MAGRISKVLVTLADYFQLAVGNDGELQPRELNPFVQINYPWRQFSSEWPRNLFDEQVAPGNGSQTGDSTTVPQGKYRYVFSAGLISNDPTARQAQIKLLMFAAGPVATVPLVAGVVTTNLAVNNGPWLAVNRAFLMPPGSALRFEVDAIGGLNQLVGVYNFCQYNVGDEAPMI